MAANFQLKAQQPIRFKGCFQLRQFVQRSLALGRVAEQSETSGNTLIWSINATCHTLMLHRRPGFESWLIRIYFSIKA